MKTFLKVCILLSISTSYIDDYKSPKGKIKARTSIWPGGKSSKIYEWYSSQNIGKN